MIAQGGIILFGAVSIFLIGRKTARWRRWGYLAGLFGQPFWFWATWEAEQWGIMLLAVWYTYAWADGLRNNWRTDGEEAIR
jgi:hypothetical protein